LVVIISNANVLFNLLDRTVIGEVLGETVLSYYGTPQSVINIVDALMLTVVTVTLPRLSNYLANDKDEDYSRLVNDISRLYFLILIPASFGIYILSYEAIHLYAGDQYLTAVPVLKYFAVFMLVAGFNTILTNQVMYAKKREIILAKFIFGCGIVNIFFKFILVKLDRLTPSSAIITTTISMALLVFIQQMYIKYTLKLDVKIFSKHILTYFIVSIPFFIINKIFSFIPYVIIKAPLVGGICVIYYFVVLYSIKDRMLINVINKITNILKKFI
jgi:O-antigen/teichoic acid export membrane protein